MRGAILLDNRVLNISAMLNTSNSWFKSLTSLTEAGKNYPLTKP